jgi:hypothetical protein
MGVNIKLEMTDEQKTLFKATAGREDDQGAIKSRREWAANFGDMLLRTVPINNTVREIFNVRTKPDGDMKFMIEPNDTIAWQMSKIGQFARNYIEGDVVYVPTDVYQTSVYYSLDFAEDADYSVSEVALNKLNDAVARFEETQGWMLIRAAVNNAPTAQRIQVANLNPGAGYFSKQLMNLLLLYFEIEGKALDRIYVPPTAMADVRNWTETTIDPETQRQIFVAGGLTQIWNVQLQSVPLVRYFKSIEDKKTRTKTIIDRLFNPNDKLVGGADVWNAGAKSAYAAGTLEVCYGISLEDFGIMAIKTPLRTYEDPTAILRWEQGILARERVGFIIIDSERVVMGIVDRTNTES